MGSARAPSVSKPGDCEEEVRMILYLDDRADDDFCGVGYKVPGEHSVGNVHWYLVLGPLRSRCQNEI